MKLLKLSTVFLLLSMSLSAQFNMNLKISNYQNLIYTPIKATLTVENITGNDLKFPKKTGNSPSLNFVIKNRSGQEVPKSANFYDLIAGLTLRSGAILQREVKLSSLFQLSSANEYSCKAVLSHPRISGKYQSPTVHFQIDNPPIIKDFEVGLPSKNDTDPIRSMNYSVILFETDLGAKYYLRIHDEKRVYATIPLAMKKTNYQPQFKVGARSQIHALIYSAPKIFNYLIVSHDGKIKSNEVYRADSASLQPPKLVKDPDVGRIMLVNAQLADEDIDYVIRKEKEDKLKEKGLK